MRQVMMLALLGVALGGCVTDSTPATIQGACDAFEAPKLAVRGLDKDDRRWIAGQVEAGVRVCGWSRPKAREVARQIGS